MNISRTSTSSRCIKGAAIILAIGIGAAVLPNAKACLTSNIDKRTVQWSSAIVKAKLVSLGNRSDLTNGSSGATAGTTASGKPIASGYRTLAFEITDSVDGSLQAGQTVKVLSLIGGTPGQGACPAMMKESVGKSFVLMLRPFEQTKMDLPDGTALSISPGTMVIVSQLGEDDMNSDTLPDLKKLVDQTHDAASTATPDAIAAQVEAVAAAHDGTEAEQAEKALEDIGVAALPQMQARIKSATGVAKTRLRRIIADVQPPTLSAEPE